MKHKILITEDDAVTVKYMEHNAKMLGYEIIGITDSAEEAIQLCKTEKPDIVLMDVNLSGSIDGIEAADNITSLLNIPVLLISNNMDDDTLKRAVSSNSYGYLLKPVKKEQLYTIVEMTMQRYELENQLKLKDQELEALNQSLEDKVAKRTAKLIESKEDLEMFSFTTSHELLSPLHFIRFSLDSNFENYEKDHLVRIMKDLKGTCDKMYSQLQDVLVLSKISQHDPKLELVDLNDMINDILKDFSKSFDLKKYKIKLKELPNIKTDKKLIKEILQRLLKNALMYSAPKKNPEIQVNANWESDKLLIHVKDNGTGFNEEFYTALFNYFERLHSDEEFAGNGLGLSIAQKAANKLNGKIWANGKVDIGADFYCSLPKI